VTTELDRVLARDARLAALWDEGAPLLSTDPGHDAHHARRVAVWTLRLAPDVDPRLSVAAALLHDVVNVDKSSPDRHRASEASAEVAAPLLSRHGFSEDEVSLVARAIVDHSFSRGAVPESMLGKALQDADRLEALGALGLLRCVSTGVRMGARYFDPEDPWARHRELDDRRHSVDHFFTKLLGLPLTMQTEPGRREAERRVKFLEAFLVELASEIGEPLPDVPLTRER
jgi:uncharacterized protein